MNKALLALASLVLAFAIVASAQNAAPSAAKSAGASGKPAAAQAASAPSSEKSPWVPIPGIPKGVVLGIAVDPTNGDIYALTGDKGVEKSTDQGKTFDKPIAGVNGNLMYPSSLNADPAGKRIVIFPVRGQPGMTTDAGKTWTKFPGSFDFAAVDWETGGKCMFALVHESGRLLQFTTDAGATWKDVGKGNYVALGVIDDKTILAVKDDQMMRSTDAGATWTKVAKAPGVSYGQVVYVFKGNAYLITKSGLLVSKDKGATWAIQGSPVKANIGPFFGKDENHMVVVSAADGVYQTDDAGKTWKLVASPAPVGDSDFTYTWDPVNNILYAAGRTKPPAMCPLGAAAARTGK